MIVETIGKRAAALRIGMVALVCFGPTGWSVAAVRAAESIRQGPRVLRPGDHGVGRLVPALSYNTIDGVRHIIGRSAGARLTAYAFTSTSCPLSRKYLPSLVEVAATMPPEVAWVLVNPVASDKPVEMRSAVGRFTRPVAYVHDAHGRLAKALGATTTTDVVVVDAARTIQYHGAIDDQYGLGYALEAPRQRYLAAALTALLAGRQPLVAATDAPGCDLDVAGGGPAQSDVTYHGRISRILNRHCVECHREGGVGPFALDTFRDVIAHAPMMHTVVDRRTMPPWFAAADATTQEHAVWAHDRSLAAPDREALLAWLAGGRPAGDPADAPEPVTFAAGWQIGEPDAIWSFSEPVPVQATGTMPYQNILVETGLNGDRWVQAIEVRPGSPEVVHHVIVHVVQPEDPSRPPVDQGGRGTRRSDAADERGGFWGEYVPGQSVLSYPAGFAKFLPRGARLNFQMHYTPVGTATTDRTSIGVVFAKEPPRHEVRVVGIANTRIAIPPGAADHREEAALQLPHDATILGFLPHMHLRGKACRYEVLRGDGSAETLLDIPRYDFNWQLLYRYVEPLPLAAGDTLTFTAWFDNSMANPANPDPSQTVRWGPQTFDEMHLGYVEYFLPGAAPGSPAAGLRGGRQGSSGMGERRGALIDAAFRQLDRNQDGWLAREEWPERLRDKLESLDTDGDGGLTRQEARAFRP